MSLGGSRDPLNTRSNPLSEVTNRQHGPIRQQDWDNCRKGVSGLFATLSEPVKRAPRGPIFRGGTFSQLSGPYLGPEAPIERTLSAHRRPHSTTHPLTATANTPQKSSSTPKASGRDQI